jgi:hypothetical protein
LTSKAVQSLKNSGIELNGVRKHHGRPAKMPAFFVIHPLQLLAGRDLSRPHINKGIT